jgi:hypothetical protein
MYDVAYFREHAEYYRRLARTYSGLVIGKRLASLAQEFDAKAQELRRLARLRYAPLPPEMNQSPKGALHLDSMQSAIAIGSQAGRH